MADPRTLAFVDTETTSLRPDRRAWEIALILRRPGRADAPYHWFVEIDDLELGNADPFSLRIGHFYDRHPAIVGDEVSGPATSATVTAYTICDLTRDAVIVGNVPSFDTDVLDRMIRKAGRLPRWHYQLIDIENLAAGYLTAQGHIPAGPPWNSEDLSRALGVEPPAGDERHTAMGDALWVARMWDAIHHEKTSDA